MHGALHYPETLRGLNRGFIRVPLKPVPTSRLTGETLNTPFFEGYGNLVHDISPSGFILDLQPNYPTSAPRWIPSFLGWGLWFDAVDDYVRGPDDPLLDPRIGDFSVEALIQTTTIPIDRGTIVCKNGPGYYQLFVNPAGGIRFVLFDGVNLSWGVGPVVNDGIIHHLLGVRDAGVANRIYVDGVATSCADPTGDLNTAGNRLEIGRQVGIANRWFGGTIFFVRYYQGVTLSQTQVTQRYNLLRGLWS